MCSTRVGAVHICLLFMTPPLSLPQVTSGAYVVILNSVFVGEWGPQGGGLTV